MATNPSELITRRGFLELTSAGIISTSFLTEGNAAECEPGSENAVVPDASPSVYRIALEEHFAVPETFDSSYALKHLPSPEAKEKLLDVGAARVAEMDRGGISSALHDPVPTTLAGTFLRISPYLARPDLPAPGGIFEGQI
jgi:hypothetical protein